MEITEVRIFPTKSNDGRLKAYATMTFDDWFVVRNVKIIQGNDGVFVAMPSRKAVESCGRCGSKNVRGSKFCNECGGAIKKREQAVDISDGAKQMDHMDIAHPIKQECREYIQEKVLEAFEDEMNRKSTEGESYTPVSVDDLHVSGDKVFDIEKKPETGNTKIVTEEGQDIEL